MSLIVDGYFALTSIWAVVFKDRERWWIQWTELREDLITRSAGSTFELLCRSVQIASECKRDLFSFWLFVCAFASSFLRAVTALILFARPSTLIKEIFHNFEGTENVCFDRKLPCYLFGLNFLVDPIWREIIAVSLFSFNCSFGRLSFHIIDIGR